MAFEKIYETEQLILIKHKDSDRGDKTFQTFSYNLILFWQSNALSCKKALNFFVLN